jgi:hypothetical protein
MIKQTIKKIAIILIIGISIIGNLYWIGNYFWKKETQKFFNSGVAFVFETAKKNGSVTYTTTSGEKIILILQR